MDGKEVMDCSGLRFGFRRGEKVCAALISESYKLIMHIITRLRMSVIVRCSCTHF